ncbi:alpha/beta hydrolase [Microbacter margulisiae]|uniref:Alpha-beta hydrolase superfamily lysophospholipase n=1 Tax=Microbacter margulisiae TaxID=1350067 RepID=A0A7W5H1S4_9PORP|nr:alpha/beta hydrolase [Microbacter margulisiae]MBB3187908.1 alpha-beta hydrolase superfamily lysophospholipase [Microbacter margulisiae]
MKRLAAFILFAFITLSVFSQVKCTYVPDILGDGFQKTTLDMGVDYSGPVVATLIRKLNPDTTVHKAVLYIHGYDDYFFQKDMANEYIKHGYNFYALDLRKCGRSILPGQIKFDVRNVVEYYGEIDEALQIIHQEKNHWVLLSGHSMGGLVASVYAEDRIGKEKFDALFLDSPFFDWNVSPVVRATILPIAADEGSRHPEKTRKGPDYSLYGESLNKNFKGEWNYNLEWKMLQVPVMTYGWISAMYNAIQRVQDGLHIQKPVLVMISDRSIHPKTWTNDLFKADAVLNVNSIKKYAANIATNVQIIQIHDGMHDLVLSPKPVRDVVYKDLFNYLSTIAPKNSMQAK